MRYVPKSIEEPLAFIQAVTETHPKSGDAERKTTYGSLISKKPLRQFLIEQQHTLCCYCQSEIELATSLTEHYIARSKDDTLSLQYQNLYASCECNELRRSTIHDTKGDFCGHAKQAKSLVWSPIKDELANASESRPNPFFTVNLETGHIEGKGWNKTDIDAFIQVCNLNHTHLERARAAAFNALTETGNDLNTLLKIVSSVPSLPYNQFLINALHS